MKSLLFLILSLQGSRPADGSLPHHLQPPKDPDPTRLQPSLLSQCASSLSLLLSSPVTTEPSRQACSSVYPNQSVPNPAETDPPHPPRPFLLVIMNDPGLDKPINESSTRVEDERKEEEEQEREDEQAFLNPSRWWFASTAFPLLAGTFGPMASAFNICALVENWRVSIPPGLGANEAHGNNIPDPQW